LQSLQVLHTVQTAVTVETAFGEVHVVHGVGDRVTRTGSDGH
jgi:hypothetical protein